MGEVLSQSQIDAMLNSLLMGGGSNDSSDDTTTTANSDEGGIFPDVTGSKERKYDFTTPKRFTKERIKLFDSVYSNYTRVVSSYLSGILRLLCDVELVSIEEQKYYEFNNALGENDILAVVDVKLDETDYQNDPAMIHISNSVVYTIIDRLMGGWGQIYEDSASAFTDIEISLYKNLVTHIIPFMNDVWQNYFDVKFDFLKVETNPRLIQTVNMNDTVVIVMLNVTIEGNSGQMNICLPGDTLELICKKFEHSNLTSRAKNQDERSVDDIISNLIGSTLEVIVKMSEGTVSLHDINTLKIGDIINLNKPKQSDMTLYVENKPWFTGELGTHNKNLAIRINGPAVI